MGGDGGGDEGVDDVGDDIWRQDGRNLPPL